MEDIYKEVYFNKYCDKCKYSELEEIEDPCFECLATPTNLYSHKPIHFKQKENA